MWKRRYYRASEADRNACRVSKESYLAEQTRTRVLRFQEISGILRGFQCGLARFHCTVRWMKRAGWSKAGRMGQGISGAEDVRSCEKGPHLRRSVFIGSLSGLFKVSLLFTALLGVGMVSESW